MKKLHRFNDFKQNKSLNENKTVEDTKDAIEGLFKKFNGEIPDEYIRGIWNNESDEADLRELYGEQNFDRAWSKLIDEEKIKMTDGENWCWCDMVQEGINESISKDDEEKYLSPKQRKLPEGLKKAIISRAKKAKKSKKDTDKK